ncbi:PREDICTED: kelch-like protein 4 [Cyprinodon variegatus]|uniref:kelch-like protein 4 n=1 Tax=Cyprinodon variegatus TaxID=28743 RepID=UPI0007424D7C|nr:PREDICTED: kelch-like protein 4 [Cyprinodon variegatus]
MEFTRRYLPMEWEERWRKEKERRKRMIEEGGEGLERDNNELRQIVAYNNSKMGLKSLGDKTEENDLRKTEIDMESTSECMSGKGFGDVGQHVCTYSSRTFHKDIFKTLKELQNSSLLTDLTLTTENGRNFNVHSLILAAVSGFILEKLNEINVFQSWNTEGKIKMRSVLIGSEVDEVGLQAIIEFAYCGDVSILNKDTITQIKTAAEVLKVPRLLDLCNNMDTRCEDQCPKIEQDITFADVNLKNTLQSIERMWRDKVGCDVILEVDGTFFHVHRVILAASSDYFRGMFTSGMKESHQNYIALPFIPSCELETLINWSYRGTLVLSWDSVFEITCTALQLQFQPAFLLCLRFLQEQIHINSCLDVASFAEAYGLSGLLEEANDFILRNFREVSATAKFQDLAAENFVHALDQAISGYGVTAINGGIFISGGFNCKYVCLVTMFLYHPESGSIYLADMSNDRAQHCMEALQGCLYVAGGVCNMRKFYTDQLACEVYNPVTDTWTDFASLPVPHVGAASAVLEEKIYVLGGYCQDDYSESGLVHRFDRGLQRWENMGKLPGAVTDIKACLINLPQHFRL